jgi:TetR/AcrR family acrAB operon transcriptional repressor
MATRPTPEARKQAILEAALGVFAQYGFDAATTEDIAQAAGLSKGGLYWHFKSKDEILAAMLSQLFDQEMVVLSRLVESNGSVASRLRQLVRQAIDTVLEMEHTLPVIREFSALAARNAGVRQSIQSYYQRYHGLLTALLQQGFTSGEFHTGTAESVALTLLAQLEGLGLVWSIAPQMVELRAQAEAAAELLLRGLMAGERY